MEQGKVTQVTLFTNNLQEVSVSIVIYGYIRMHIGPKLQIQPCEPGCKLSR